LHGFRVIYGIVFTGFSIKEIPMNTNTDNPKPVNKNNNRPDVRDNLDSRKNEEQDFKGDDVTHNKKETESEKAKKK
jgi:hypothetical protein